MAVRVRGWGLMEGTALVRVKQALADALALFDINFLYDSPLTPEGVLGADGSGRACWFDDDNITASLQVAHMMGGPVELDEVITIPVKVQALGRSSDDTQAEVDASASALLGQIIAVLARNPSLGLSDDEIVVYHAIPAGWTYSTGAFPDSSSRAGGYVLNVEVTSRLALEVYG